MHDRRPCKLNHKILIYNDFGVVKKVSFTYFNVRAIASKKIKRVPIISLKNVVTVLLVKLLLLQPAQHFKRFQLYLIHRMVSLLPWYLESKKKKIKEIVITLVYNLAQVNAGNRQLDSSSLEEPLIYKTIEVDIII